MTVPEQGDLEERVRALESKVALLEGQPPHLAIRIPPPPPPPPAGAPRTPPIPPAIDSTPAPATPAAAGWLDALTTEVALKWAGLGLLFLAAAFLVSSAISRGWIGPELQLLGAATLGFALIASGITVADSLPRWAQPLALAGAAVLFTSSGAASQWLDIGGVTSGAAATTAVLVLTVTLSRRFSWLLLGLLSLFGSLIVWSWVGTAREFGFAAVGIYTLGLAVLLHWLALDRRWPLLYATTALTLIFVQMNIAGEREDLLILQVLFIATAIAHWVAPIVFDQLSDQTDVTTRLAGRVTLIVPVWLWGSTVVLHDLSTNQAIGVSAAVSGAAIISGVAFRERAATWLWAAQLLAASVAVSAGLVYWLDGSTLLGALAAQAVVMLVLSRRIDDTWFWWQSILTSAVVSLIALVLTIDAIDSDAAWNADLVHLFVFTAALGIGLANRSTDEGRLISLVAYASLLLWVASVCIHFGQGQVAISAIWATVGVAVVAVGLSRHNMLAARAGLGTLGVVVVKLLSVDLAEIDTFWRAGLFFLVGLGFLWLGYSVPGLLGRERSSKPDT